MATTVIFTDKGEEHVVDKIDGTSYTALFGFIGWGTGVHTAAKTDTALTTESAETRATVTPSQPAADTLRMVGTITATATRVITEAGVFTLVSAGLLLISATFSAINLDSGDSIQFTFNLQFT